MEENSTLGQAVNSWNGKSNGDEQTPTGWREFTIIELLIRLFITSDESGSDSEEDSPNSCYSSLNDFVFEMRNSEICGEIRGKSYSSKSNFSLGLLV